jgi:hypothetical protein
MYKYRKYTPGQLAQMPHDVLLQGHGASNLCEPCDIRANKIQSWHPLCTTVTMDNYTMSNRAWRIRHIDYEVR